MFYSQDINSLFLDDQESLHAVKVLRLKTGAEIEITEGKGKSYSAVITKDNSRKCEFKILGINREQFRLGYETHIGIAPAKNNDRNEWFVEKVTELGVTSITFLQCERSERKSLNIDRLKKVAISAMKQSLNIKLPEINDIRKFSVFIKESSLHHKYIAHLMEGNIDTLFSLAGKNTSSVVLIGPEGDFTKGEIEQAILMNFIPVSLGKSRLRTETAGMVACHTINLKNEL